MSADLKALIKQSREDYRGEQQTNLLAEAGQLQKGGLSFEEAWASAKAAHPELQAEEVPKS